MASSAHRLAQNFGLGGIKSAFMRLGDDKNNVSTTDVYFLSGTGAPSGAYNLPTGASAVYLREDAGSIGTLLYGTVNAGTNWTVYDPSTTSGASLTISDTFALQFGTPGTDVVVTADGTDAVVTGTGVLYAVDNMQIGFGTGKDIAIAWDATRLNVTQATPNSEIRWGVDGAGIDQMWYGDTASTYMTWDQSADSLIFADNAKAVFGTGSDIAISWDATRLNITQAAPNSEIRVGVDGAGIDVRFYGDTASQSLVWDQSADAVVMTAAVSITGQGSTVVPVIPIAAPQALAGSGAVTITEYYTTWDTTGGGAGTLADGAQKGQLKKIQLIVDAGDGTLTPTNLAGGTTITFADVGDYAVLCWNGADWVAIELGNDADGVTAPVLA